MIELVIHLDHKPSDADAARNDRVEVVPDACFFCCCISISSACVAGRFRMSVRSADVMVLDSFLCAPRRWEEMDDVFPLIRSPSSSTRTLELTLKYPDSSTVVQAQTTHQRGPARVQRRRTQVDGLAECLGCVSTCAGRGGHVAIREWIGEERG